MSGMLPKNKLRRVRLERLRIFEDEHAGPFMRNVVKRYDNIVIPSRTNTKDGSAMAAELENENPKKMGFPGSLPSSKAKRQDDTPPVGSLGGLKPVTIHPPKAKRVKIKRKPLPPGLMRIFDSKGQEWGGRKPASESSRLVQANSGWASDNEHKIHT